MDGDLLEEKASARQRRDPACTNGMANGIGDIGKSMNDIEAIQDLVSRYYLCSVFSSSAHLRTINRFMNADSLEICWPNTPRMRRAVLQRSSLRQWPAQQPQASPRLYSSLCASYSDDACERPKSEIETMSEIPAK